MFEHNSCEKDLSLQGRSLLIHLAYIVYIRIIKQLTWSIVVVMRYLVVSF